MHTGIHRLSSKIVIDLTDLADSTRYTGVLASGGGASTLVHVSSTRPDGGYSFVKVMAPATSFNPHLVRSPQGMFAL